MAEYQAVTINEPSEEENITLEQENAMQEEAKAQKEGDPQPVVDDRPEWLDDKFNSPEDLANAYEELQKKQSQSSDQEKDTTEEELSEDSQSALGQTIEQASEEFAETGELSDKMFKALEKAGIPSDFVNAYLEGQESISVSQGNEVQQTIGGSDNYDAMVNWAKESLTEGEIEAYDDVVTNGTLDQAKMAVQGMYSRFLGGNGKAPSLAQGSTSGDAVKPFSSAAQVTEAMSDKRYTSDPAYRAEVAKRLQVSNVI